VAVYCFQADGEDELKKRQLMELAIINGTYRDSSIKVAATAAGIYIALVSSISGLCWQHFGISFGLVFGGEYLVVILSKFL
jgi:hypothetical protein